MTERIAEATTKPQTKGSHWSIVAITPGKGSSGVYTEEMLRSTGPAAFPKGTHSYINHSADGKRDPRDLFGVTTEDASYEPGVGLVTTLQVLPQYKEWAEAVAEHVGLSIYASADRAQDASGEWIVEGLVPDRMNSVDVVSYSGREGSRLEKLLESARSSFDKTSSVTEDSGTAPADKPNHTKGKKETSQMEIEDLATRVETLAESLAALTALVTPLAESLTAEQAKAAKEAEEADKAPEYDFALIAEAAIAAGLPEAARKVVYNQVRLGAATVEEAISAQKEYVESVQQSVRETLGATVRVGTDSVNQDFSVSRWVVVS